MALRKITNLIRTTEEWKSLLSQTHDLTGKVIQNINFSKLKTDWTKLITENAVFLGCNFKKEDALYLISTGSQVYPKFSNLPYNPHRSDLYTWQELLQKVNGDSITYDEKIYKHFTESKYNPSLEEAMAQRIHDYSIDVGLRNLVEHDETGMTSKKIVGFMGGHSTRRDSEYYYKVAFAAKKLSEKGYFIATGGGRE